MSAEIEDPLSDDRLNGASPDAVDTPGLDMNGEGLDDDDEDLFGDDDDEIPTESRAYVQRKMPEIYF